MNQLETRFSSCVLVTIEVKDKHCSIPGFTCCRLLLSHRVWPGLSYHLSGPTLQLLQKDPIRPGADKNPLPAFWVLFTGGTLRPGDDRVIPDKPPQFTTVVSQAFFSLCQLQRRSHSDNCIQTLDLQFAIYVAEPLRWGAASFVC